MYSCTLDVKHDAKVNGYTAQHGKAVHKGPVRGVQGDLVEDKKMTLGYEQPTTQHVLASSKLQSAKMFSAFCFRIRYLQVDYHDKGGRRDHSEGLVIRRRLSVLTHRLQERTIRDEEDDEGREDAVEEADEEVLVIKQRPLLTRKIQLWKAQTQFVVHILHTRHKRNIRVGMQIFP